MLEEIVNSVRRLARTALPVTAQPLVRVGEGPADAVVMAQADIGMLRGVSDAAADQADCMCPEPCERDHANE